MSLTTLTKYDLALRRLSTREVNPVIALILIRRALGEKHSDLPWEQLRTMYDYTVEMVAAP